MLKWYLTLIFVFAFSYIPAGNGEYSNFRVTGRVRVEQGLVEGTQITLRQGNSVSQELTVNRSGNFVVSLQLGQVYVMVFSKEGFYPKEIEIDTRIPSSIPSSTVFPPYQVSMFLLKSVPGIEPPDKRVGRIVYNSTIDNFDVDAGDKTEDYKKVIEEAIRTIRQQSENHERKASETKIRNYQSLVRQAEVLAGQQQYPAAMEKYREASRLFPFDPSLREKVSSLHRLSAIDQMGKTFGPPSQAAFSKYMNYGDTKIKERESTLALVAYEILLRIKPDDQELRNKHDNVKREVEELMQLGASEMKHKQMLYEKRKERYTELVTLADAELRQERFSNARDQYALAAGQIEENSYAVAMLQKIDEILNNDEKALALAKEKEEQEKKRIREAREKAYNDAISEADRLFERRFYRDAIENYELALTIKSWEIYPKNQIRIINDLIAALQSGGVEYNRLLREADQLMHNKEYEPARVAYEQAHKLLPNETYALSQIRAIDSILASLEAERERNKSYNAEIKKADELFQTGSFNDAILAYQKAQAIKPDERYPFDQIRKIRGLISQASESSRAKMQQQTDYDQAISMADKAFNEKLYASAKAHYQRALVIWPEQNYPQNQINRIDRLMSELTQAPPSSKLDQIDFENLDKVSQVDRDEAYKEAMALGESFFKSKEWGIARFYFRKALALIPGDKTAQNRLNDVEMQVRGGNVNESLYAEMIKKGDEAFRGGDFSVARFYYSKALEAKTGDNYANERLGVVNHMISTESTFEQPRVRTSNAKRY